MKFFDNKWPAIFLWPIAVLYGAVIRIRNFCYDSGIFNSYAVGCKVICVGNITVGGTGKTPMVQFIVRALLSLGKRVAIVSRGYGRSTSDGLLVSDGEKILRPASEAGDEPWLLARSCKGAIVAVDKDRVRMAREIVKSFSPDVIVLDDAFQHRRIKRDLDVVMIRSGKAFGNGFLLPAGPLREPVSGLRRAQLIMLRKPNDEVTRISLQENIPVFNFDYQILNLCNHEGPAPALELELQGARVIAFSGIANPSSFLNTLGELNLNILDYKAFQDHHQYTASDIKHLLAGRERLDAQYIITTEKDWVKLPPQSLDAKWLYLAIHLVPENESDIVSRFEMLF